MERQLAQPVSGQVVLGRAQLVHPSTQQDATLPSASAVWFGERASRSNGGCLNANVSICLVAFKTRCKG